MKEACINIKMYRSRLLASAGFENHGFTRRVGGGSEGSFESLNLAHDVGDNPDKVAQNLRRFQENVGVDMPLARVKQVHGVDAIDGVKIAQEDWTVPPFAEGDAIVTAKSSTVVAVQTADCAAVLLADPETGAVAAIHAGWRGAARGVVRNAVRKMSELGASCGSMLAAVGPCICPMCYEVGDDVARLMPESCDPVKGKQGKFQLDLSCAVEVSLIGAGLTTSNIERLDACNSCFTGELFSYRRDGGTCGRGLGFIVS